MKRPESSLQTDPLGLRQLPSRPAPESLWPAIEARLAPPAPRRLRPAWLGLAAAAAVAAVLLLQPWQPWSRSNEAAIELVSVPDDSAQALASARRLSAALEAELEHSRRNPLPVDALAGLVWTETELRLTDELLLDDPGSLELWWQRIALLGELNQRYQRNHWQQDLLLTSL